MGKPNSFLYCRMHDMKKVVWPDMNSGITMLQVAVPPIMEKFTETYPEFSENNTALAICGMISLDDSELRVKYQQHMNKCGDDLLAAVSAIVNTEEELIDILDTMPTDNRVAIYVTSFCFGMLNMKNEACVFLDRVLQMEESGIDVKDDLVIWVALACLCDFETWHDAKYGSPIIGKSQFTDKDENGNQLQNNGVSQPAQSSGGCYIATSVYGSYDCPEVCILRRYRDYKLAGTFWGRIFIRVYYSVSPTIVRWAGNTKWFNKIWRYRLDKMVKSLRDKGFDSTPYEDKVYD